jgi:ribonuclease R
LGKTNYTHFTSPIRRYADLLVHRALFDRPSPVLPQLREAAQHISETERNSADAERDSKDVKVFAFLKGQLKSGRRELYPALVTDVRNFGFFVEVAGVGMSGLVHLSSVEDDFFVFDATRGCLVGRRTRRMIQLGDRVTVRVYKVDSFKKQVDFQLESVSKSPDKAPRALPPQSLPPSPGLQRTGRRIEGPRPGANRGNPMVVPARSLERAGFQTRSEGGSGGKERPAHEVRAVETTRRPQQNRRRSGDESI